MKRNLREDHQERRHVMCVDVQGEMQMDSPERQLIYLIESLTYSFGMQSIEGRCCNENISHVEFRALQCTLHQNVCTMQDIARSAAVTKSGATRIARRLEDKGLAVRRQDRKDGRFCCVSLTEEGKLLLTRIEEQLMNRTQKALEAMDPALREILLISLGRFVQAMEQREVDSVPQGEVCCEIPK